MCAAGGNSRHSFCCHRFSVFATLLLASAPPSLLLTSARATPLVGVCRTSPLSPLPLPLLSSTSATPLCAASLSRRLRSPRPTPQWLPRSSSCLRSAPPLLASARTPPPGGCRAPSPPLLPPLLASARAPPLRWRPRSSIAIAFAPAPPLLASARAPPLGGCRAPRSPSLLCPLHASASARTPPSWWLPCSAVASASTSARTLCARAVVLSHALPRLPRRQSPALCGCHQTLVSP